MTHSQHEEVGRLLQRLDGLTQNRVDLQESDVGLEAARLRRAIADGPVDLDSLNRVNEQLFQIEDAIAQGNHVLAAHMLRAGLLSASPNHAVIIGQIAEMERRVSDLETARSRMDEIERKSDAVLQVEAANEMSKKFERRAGDHRKGWRLASAGIVFSIAGVTAIALLLHRHRPAPDASGAEIAGSAAFAVLTLGLALYVVKVFAQSYRSHRNLEVSNRARADALSTYHLLVQGQGGGTAEVMAAALAGLVFAREPTGYETDTPPITVSDQLLQTAVTRLSSGGTTAK